MLRLVSLVRELHIKIALTLFKFTCALHFLCSRYELFQLPHSRWYPKLSLSAQLLASGTSAVVQTLILEATTWRNIDGDGKCRSIDETILFVIWSIACISLTLVIDVNKVDVSAVVTLIDQRDQRSRNAFGRSFTHRSVGRGVYMQWP